MNNKKYLIKDDPKSKEISTGGMLPVFGEKEKILQLIDNNKAVVIVGETGSGKTTRISSL